MNSSDAVSVLSSLTDITKPVVETSCDLLHKLLGRPCEVAGNLMADQLYAWQWANRIRIVAWARKLLEVQNIAPGVLPKGFLVPLLDAAGDIEEPTLQEMWANLLVSGIRSEKNQERGFIRILEQLSINEAKLLELIGKDHFRYTEECIPPTLNGQQNWCPAGPDLFPLRKFGITDNELREMLSHLATLGLIFPEVENDPIFSNNQADEGKALASFFRFTTASLTRYGSKFVAACVTTPISPTVQVKESYESTFKALEIARIASRKAEKASKLASSIESELDEVRFTADEALEKSEEAGKYGP